MVVVFKYWAFECVCVCVSVRIAIDYQKTKKIFDSFCKKPEKYSTEINGTFITWESSGRIISLGFGSGEGCLVVGTEIQNKFKLSSKKKIFEECARSTVDNFPFLPLIG